MKTCPTCQRTFSDESLTFCLVDGSVLSAPSDPNKTLVMPEPRVTDPPRSNVEPPQSTILAVSPQAAFAVHQPINRGEKRSGPWLWIGLALTFAILILAVIVGSFLWMSGRQESPGTDVRSGKLTPTESPTEPTEDVWEEHPNTSINEGERITFYVGTTSEACRNDCLNNSNCRAYTFIKAGAYNPGDSQMCYLMSEVKTLNSSPCCFTGVKK